MTLRSELYATSSKSRAPSTRHKHKHQLNLHFNTCVYSFFTQIRDNSNGYITREVLNSGTYCTLPPGNALFTTDSIPRDSTRGTSRIITLDRQVCGHFELNDGTRGSAVMFDVRAVFRGRLSSE